VRAVAGYPDPAHPQQQCRPLQQRVGGGDHHLPRSLSLWEEQGKARVAAAEHSTAAGLCSLQSNFFFCIVLIVARIRSLLKSVGLKLLHVFEGPPSITL